jgi:hypothetical protein
MKKLRFSMLLFALVMAVTMALATKPGYNCTYADQFYYNGAVYVPVATVPAPVPITGRTPSFIRTSMRPAVRAGTKQWI